MSNDTTGDPAPKPRSFADAAALLPSVVPVPRAKPTEAPPREPPAEPPSPDRAGPATADPPPLPAPKVTKVRAGIFAAAFPPGAELSSPIRLDGLLAGVATFVRRRPWVLAVPLAAAGGFAAWHGVGHAPVLAVGSPSATQAPTARAPTARASAPGGADTSEAAPQKSESAIGRPQPIASAGRPDAEVSPAQPAALPPDKTVAGSPLAAAPDAAPIVPYSLIVLHPRPASATGDAANGRITALLQPLAARLEMQKQAGTKGRLTVHYFHDEDAQAAKALADAVRTPGARVHVRGPVRTRAPWPRNAFEVWLRGP